MEDNSLRGINYLGERSTICAKGNDLGETAIWRNQTVRLYPPENQPRHAAEAKWQIFENI
ncbi:MULTISPECIES: hypothetical protein [unclassified Brucella]|uniref:hypothetical protein n=1 Tax=unclassified Brucella TaxID=2632610 RepID=UPI00217DD32C|nr:MULTISPECIES: hypothetical protein [unclassified Brucella]UWF67849.1 hypothetical protein NYO63_14575 [Brucella sp. 1315]UWF70968.1 hypothetical protein NYO65_14565 [Brucella sp. 2594]